MTPVRTHTTWSASPRPWASRASRVGIARSVTKGSPMLTEVPVLRVPPLRATKCGALSGLSNAADRRLKASKVTRTPAAASCASAPSSPSRLTSASRSWYRQPAASSRGRYGLARCSKIARRARARNQLSRVSRRPRSTPAATPLSTGCRRNPGRSRASRARGRRSLTAGASRRKSRETRHRQPTNTASRSPPPGPPAVPSGAQDHRPPPLVSRLPPPSQRAERTAPAAVRQGRPDGDTGPVDDASRRPTQQDGSSPGAGPRRSRWAPCRPFSPPRYPGRRATLGGRRQPGMPGRRGPGEESQEGALRRLPSSWLGWVTAKALRPAGAVILVPPPHRAGRPWGDAALARASRALAPSASGRPLRRSPSAGPGFATPRRPRPHRSKPAERSSPRGQRSSPRRRSDLDQDGCLHRAR